MSNKLPLLLAAILAGVAMSAATTGATAASFSVSPGGSISLGSLGLLTFEEAELGVIARCGITLLSSLHRGQFAKASGALVGHVTFPRDQCSDGRILTLPTVTMPWHIVYSSISGTLPSAVTGMVLNIPNFNALFEIPLGILGTWLCLYNGSLPLDVAIAGTNPYTTGLARAETLLLLAGSLNEPLIPCPAALTVRGSFSLTTQTLTRLG